MRFVLNTVGLMVLESSLRLHGKEVYADHWMNELQYVDVQHRIQDSMRSLGDDCEMNVTPTEYHFIIATLQRSERLARIEFGEGSQTHIYLTLIDELNEYALPVAVEEADTA